MAKWSAKRPKRMDESRNRPTSRLTSAIRAAAKERQFVAASISSPRVVSVGQSVVAAAATVKL